MIITRMARAASILAAATFVAAAAVPAGATASDPTSEAKPARSAAKTSPANDKRRYCVSTKVTGSILARKECKTRVDWIAATGIDPAKQN